MQNKCIVIGSRSSKLALTQAKLIKDKFHETYSELNIEIRTIKTTGDKILDVPLSKIGDKGLFTKEIEEALLRKEIDLAVHSMKDLPVEIPQGLKISAITERENASDVLMSGQGFNLATLPKGSKVGTSSLRRRAQLLNNRSDLEILDLRGNLDTRIKKLEQGLFDAIVVAYAGVKRLGLGVNTSLINTDDILPQAGQGALGIETHEDNICINNRVRVLDDSNSRLCIEAERTLLSSLGGGCQIPIGVFAETNGQDFYIKAGVFSLDGKKAIRKEIKGDKKEYLHLAMQLADRLVESGAKEILDKITNKNF